MSAPQTAMVAVIAEALARNAYRFTLTPPKWEGQGFARVRIFSKQRAHAWEEYAISQVGAVTPSNEHCAAYGGAEFEKDMKQLLRFLKKQGQT